VVIVDDMGFADVSYHGSAIPTPFLDSLSQDGIRFNNYYTHPVCSPSRASLLTGRYSQDVCLSGALLAHSLITFPNETTTIGQALKEKGYHTHFIGKWHVGHSRWSHTPLGLGFDSFFGTFNGGTGHFSKIVPNMDLYDLWDNKKPVVVGTHSTILFTQQFEDRVKTHVQQHSSNAPFFSYVSYLAPHSPLQPDETHTEPCKHIQSSTRRDFCGLVVGVDRAVANITAILKQYGMWEDTILIFTSDNGGMPHMGGLNYPFRGAKFGPFEGGARTVSFIHGSQKYLKQRGYTYQGLMHISDWYPTILSFAKDIKENTESKKKQSVTTSYDLAEALSENLQSPRKEVVLALDPIAGMFSYRFEDWKFIWNVTTDTDSNLYYEPGRFEKTDHTTIVDKIAEFSELSLEWFLGSTEALFWRELINNVRLRIRFRIYGLDIRPSSGSESNYLFDLATDPTESHNLADQKPEIVQMMKSRLQVHLDRLPADYLTRCNWQEADIFDRNVTHDGPWLDDDEVGPKGKIQNVLMILATRFSRNVAIFISILILTFVVARKLLRK